MSVAYYIVLDHENPGFETFVNGKFLAKEAKRLDAICQKMAIPTLDHFVCMSQDELADLLAEDIECPEGEQWFTAEEGLAVVTALMGHLQAHPQAVKNFTGVLEDLAEYAEVLKQAQAIGAKWHLSLDI